MIIEHRPISPALSSLYAAIEHRERIESLLVMSEATEATGIDLYRHHRRRADDEAVFSRNDKREV
mgnify:FL=1